MAKNPVSILFLLMTMAWIMMNVQGNQPASKVANRQSRHVFLFPQATSANDMSSFDFEYNPYNLPMNILAEGSFASEGSDPRIPNTFSRPVTSPSLYSGNSGTATGKTFGAFSNFFGNRNWPICPSCPACPSLTCPVCQTCRTCPVVPAPCPGTTNAADPISITIDGATACTVASTGVNNFGTGGCTRVTAAPTGVFTVSFTGAVAAAAPYPTAFIGIVATCPNTKITVKCGTFGALAVTTQTKVITTGGSAMETGSAIITVGKGTQAIDSVSCTWTASV